MPDIVISIFKLESNRGYSAPRTSIRYLERDTGAQWIINCGGTRAYLVRVGDNLDKDLNEQSADSHFMASRVTTTLLLSGCGLFRATSMGRLHIEDISFSEMRITSHLDVPPEEQKEDQINTEFSDWYVFICQNTLFRRAADDAYAALSNPVEADFYLYRGMEWLLKAASIGWRELASDIGISIKDIRQFKRQVNVELGQRHGVESGRKRRAMTETYGSLVADFIYGLSNVRKRVDQDFPGMSPKRAAEIVARALSVTPYP